MVEESKGATTKSDGQMSEAIENLSAMLDT